VCITGERGPDSGRYRGVTTAADTGNTGVVTLQSGGEAEMNDLDRVLYMGADVDIWVKFKVMRWDAVTGTWTALTPENSQVEYMEALNDMTEGAPDGVFSNVFCRVLFAQRAAIDTLQTMVITLQNGGRIKSHNYIAGASGFSLDSEGNAELSDILIRGNSVFAGDIESGPLELNDRNSASPGTVLPYTQGTSTKAWYDYCVLHYGITTGYIAVNGVYGSIGFSYFSNNYTIKDTIDTRIYDKDFKLLANFRIKNPLSYPNFETNFQIGFWNPTGKTFKLNDLPTSEPDLIGAIWKDSSGYLRIKM
jgi:hypothetical protein